MFQVIHSFFISIVISLFKTENLRTVGIVPEALSPHFKVQVKEDDFEISCWAKINGHEWEISDNQLNSSLLFFFQENLYLWKEAEDVSTIELFISKGRIIVPRSEWPDRLKSYVLPLTKKYFIEFDKTLITQIKDGQPEKKLMLQEKVITWYFNQYFLTKVSKRRRVKKMILLLLMEKKY